MKKNNEKEIIENAHKMHKTWHKFSNWLVKIYGKDLWGKQKYIKFKDANGKQKKLKFKDFNEFELSKRLVGYDVMCKVKKYVERYCPEIKIIRCDDSVYASSDILLIPHPEHGITIMFIPQCTNIQNQFFLYQGHYKLLLKELNKMKYVYTNCAVAKIIKTVK